MKLPNLFAPQTSPVPFTAGETIFAAGQPGDTMYLVQAGEVELRLHDRTLETVGPEGWFGEMALIEGGVRSADAVACTDCTLVPVNERQFLFMVGETPFFALQLLRTLSRRLRLADAAALVIVVLLAVCWMTAAPDAAAQTLLVDQADTNSPDTVTTNQTYTEVHVGDNGTGVLNQTAGTFTVNGSNTNQGLFIAYNVNSNGTYTLSGTGSLVSNYSTDVGTFGVALFSQSAGSAAFNNVGLFVGHYSGSNGTYNQTGGSVTVSGLNLGYFGGSTGAYTLGVGGTLSTGTSNVGLSGTGTFTQTGGTWTTNGSPIQVGYNSGSAGTLNLNGGTVTAGSVSGNPGGGGNNSTLNFNGGTVQAAASTTNFVSGLATANVRAGGAAIDSNGFNVTVPQGLGHDPTLGTTADGGLTKVGAGILTLSAANTYTGATTVSAGTLAISANGGLGQGNVTIDAGGALTLSAGVTAAHNASTGTTLTLAATSTINLAATTPGTVQDTVGAIVIAGVSQLLPGTYGSATSGAAHIFPEFTGNGEVLLTPVPEPGTWALLGVGTGALALATLRRRLRARRG